MRITRSVVEDLGRALTHREHRVAEVALVDEGLAGIDLHLVARLGEVLTLVLLEVGEEWDLDEVGAIHAGERTIDPMTPLVACGCRSGGRSVTIRWPDRDDAVALAGDGGAGPGQPRRDVARYSSQTSAGMRPQRIRRLNAMQPRQMAAKASSEAATVSPAISTYETGCAPASQAIEAAVVNSVPIAWAKRFGGPGTKRCSTWRRGVTTWLPGARVD